MKTTDGTGAPIDDDALYFVMDARGTVGNCGSWWAPHGAGYVCCYVCCIDDAGRYTGSQVRSMRDVDVPWPIDYVVARTVRHVRVDNQGFERRDDHQPRRLVAVAEPIKGRAVGKLDRRGDGDRRSARRRRADALALNEHQAFVRDLKTWDTTALIYWFTDHDEYEAAPVRQRIAIADEINARIPRRS